MNKSRQNEAPRLVDPLITLTARILEAARSFGDEIGLAQNTYAKIATDFHALTGTIGASADSALGAQAIYNQAKADKSAARTVLNKNETEARATYRACMTRLKPELGYSWNAKWHAAGFSNSSIALPKDPLPALLQLRAFFLENAHYENEAFGMTAEHLREMAAALQVARTEALHAENRRVAAKQTRDAALRTLYKRVVGVRRELLQLLAPDDPRWFEFGYKPPIAGRQPAEVSDVQVRPAGEGEAIVTWTPSARAKSYRVIIQDESAPDAAPKEILTKGTEVVVPVPATDAPVRVSVSALNGSGKTRPYQIQTALPAPSTQAAYSPQGPGRTPVERPQDRGMDTLVRPHSHAFHCGTSASGEF